MQMLLEELGPCVPRAAREGRGVRRETRVPEGRQPRVHRLLRGPADLRARRRSSERAVVGAPALGAGGARRGVLLFILLDATILRGWETLLPRRRLLQPRRVRGSRRRRGRHVLLAASGRGCWGWRKGAGELG